MKASLCILAPPLAGTGSGLGRGRRPVTAPSVQQQLNPAGPGTSCLEDHVSAWWFPPPCVEGTRPPGFHLETSVGSLLDLCWISVGSLLDLWRISGAHSEIWVFAESIHFPLIDDRDGTD